MTVTNEGYARGEILRKFIIYSAECHDDHIWAWRQHFCYSAKVSRASFVAVKIRHILCEKASQREAVLVHVNISENMIF